MLSQATARSRVQTRAQASRTYAAWAPLQHCPTCDGHVHLKLDEQRLNERPQVLAHLAVVMVRPHHVYGAVQAVGREWGRGAAQRGA